MSITLYGKFIIRFEGTMTQGPNAGKSYTFATSWGGVGRKTEEQARELLATYREREPGLTFKLLFRDWIGSADEGKFVETEIAI